MCTQYSASGVQGFLCGPACLDNNVSYWFPQSVSEYKDNASRYGNGELLFGFEGLDESQQAYFEDVFAMYASVSNLNFTEKQSGEIWIGATNNTHSAHAYLPDTSGHEASDIWLKSNTSYSNLELGQFNGMAVMHELGHTLGLIHPHEIDDFNPEYDHMSMTIMSYNSTPNSKASGYTNQVGHYAQSLMRLDILAIQARYGVNYDYNDDDTIYTFDSVTGAMSINGTEQSDGSGDTIFRTIWDGNGTDSFDLSNFESDANIDLQSGGFLEFSENQLAKLDQNGQLATANVFLAFDPDGSGKSLIENVKTGSGNDTIKGNKANNIIDAGAGNDKIQAGDGNDILIGGKGDDILRGGHGNDILKGDDGNNILVGGSGADSFIFTEGSSETVIRDFDARNDQLILDNSMNLADATLEYDDGNCVLTIDDTVITLLNVDNNEFNLDTIITKSNDEISLLIS